MNRSLTWEDRLDVELIDESDEDQEIKLLMQEYSWTIEKVTTLDIKLKFTFDNPTVYDGQQYISIKAQFSDFEPGWDDEAELMRVEVPRQKIPTVSPATAAKVGAAADAS